ncbi:Predicted DNA-binding transcriptional regulator YafY, contains an HTH and WYL domains [Seinonella peptonophila]|uniref:Predicted DNA-binding transcriptional regulator YafY, contains an HTH and WYL domains n=1 Tax=Seinonella peptonophila TaxID=112248 RepID=A0A1M4TYC8_9BACL|nr:YafY family protein [Seinonella peptonophila]SHE49439.1 Predicted DNA-binding transcriptional regulator YafY, contains an HTH and WYL domains [Seinonella peptonophila]
MHKSQRLLQLMMVINMKMSFTARELAEEFNLSTRTISRDLQDLSDLGFPIYSVQGRGGGYRLLRERMLPPIAFLEKEAISIFFACQSLQYFGSVPFEDEATSALHKFYHYLPKDTKEQIDRLKNKFVIWNPKRSISSSIVKTLLQAIMLQKVVAIQYSSNKQESLRNIQPIGIYASQGYWYCPAFCFMRNQYRLFRADRILHAELNDSIPFQDEIDQRTVFNWDTFEKKHLENVMLTIKLTPNGITKIDSNSWFHTADYEKNEDGGTTIRLKIPRKDLYFYVDMIWGLGHEAKIIEPIEAIEYINKKIELIRKQYV